MKRFVFLAVVFLSGMAPAADVLPGDSATLDGLNRKVAEKSDDPQVYVDRARFFQCCERGAPYAAADFAEACQRDPKNFVLRGELGAELLQSARVFWERRPAHRTWYDEKMLNQLEQAASALSDAIDAAPTDERNIDAYFHRGVVSYWLGEFGDSLLDFSKALVFFERNPNVKTTVPRLKIVAYRSLVFIALKRWNEAVNDINTSEPYWINFGNTLLYEPIAPLIMKERLAVALGMIGEKAKSDALFRHEFAATNIYWGDAWNHFGFTFETPSFTARYWGMLDIERGDFEQGLVRLFYARIDRFPRYASDLSLETWETAIDVCTKALEKTKDDDQSATILAARSVCRRFLAVRQRLEGENPDLLKPEQDYILAVQRSPRNKAVLLMQAMVLYHIPQKYDKEKLLGYAEMMLKTDPTFAPALMLVAANESSVAAAKKLKELSPDDPIIWGNYVYDFLRKSPVPLDAYSCILDAVEKFPENVVFFELLMLPVLYDLPGTAAEKETVFKRGIDLATRRIERLPDDVFGYRIRSLLRATLKSGDGDDDFRQAIKLDPRDFRYVSYFAEANRHGKASNAPRMLAIIDEGTEAARQANLDAGEKARIVNCLTFLKGWKRHQGGDIEGGIPLLTEVIDVDPLRARQELFYLRGGEYAQQKQWEQALLDYRRATFGGLNQFTERMVLNSCVQCLEQLKRYDEAIDTVEKLAKKNPKVKQYAETLERLKKLAGSESRP